MKYSDINYELIDMYLQSKLQGDALKDFENELHNNSNLSQEVELYKIVDEVVVCGYNENLRQQMKTDLEKFESRFSFKFWLSVILGVSIVAGAAFFTISFSNETKPQKVQFNEIQEVKKSPLVLKNKLDTLIRLKPNDTFTKHAINNTNLEGSQENENTILENKVNIVKNEVVTPIEKIKVDEQVSVIKPCNGVHMHWETETTPTCDNKTEGTIKVNLSTIRGGNAPYLIKINQIETNYLAHLASGSYDIVVSDKLGCNETKHTVVEKKQCNAKSFIISPDLGELWKFQPESNEDYNLDIINQSGQSVFSIKNISGNFDWDGASVQGGLLPLGLYVYIVEYKGGKKETGQITLIR